jgi:undecaprenyl-diphosphatase
MSLWQILVLAIVQGAAELLPVSSSAHVTIAARLMGLDLGSDPAAENHWAFLLVMLHTGTMLAVLVYFRARWKGLLSQWPALLLATVVTGAVGWGLKTVIEKVFLHGAGGADSHQIEHLFHNLPLIAASLAAVGVLIFAAGMKEQRSPGKQTRVEMPGSVAIGVVQGLCLPCRGFSRSGSTISTALFMNIERMRAEHFSFALAVLLTPAVIFYEGHKLLGHHAGATALTSAELSKLLLPGLIGMVFSFASGLVALRFLSRWLERGGWRWFGVYCLAAAAVVMAIHVWMPLVSG